MADSSRKTNRARATTRALPVFGALGALIVVLSGCSGKTTGATNITAHTALLHAVGTCDTSCSAYMRWRKVGTTNWTNAPVLKAPDPVTDKPWSQQANGLTPSTSYEYQACGKENSSSGDYVCVGPDGNGNTVDKFKTLTDRQPPGFSQSVVFSGLSQPTNIAFSRDGRVFVAEQSGIIKVFDSLDDTTPTVFADLRTEVNNFWDRGLLGLALDPKFPEKPYVYALYTYDAPIGGTAPTWGTPGGSYDDCPTPPGPTTDGCLVSGRLSRLTASGDTMTDEKVLINDWCGQFPGHTVGDLQFGGGGALYVSGGEAAGATSAIDYGQHKNACGDPPVPVGGKQKPPTAEGGALRAQSLRRPAGEPRSLDGTILRVDPNTGKGLPSNPLAGSSDANERRVVAYGLRNPFRFAVRPNSKALWIGDVGWTNVEEIDRLNDPAAGPVANFGWPCYEGVNPQPSYQAAGLDICRGLYSESGAVTPPYFSYLHSTKVVPNETCRAGSSSISGLAFGTGGPYPPRYNGALFFADYSRDCIWVMEKGGSGDPSPNQVKTFLSPAANPVDLRIGPDGNLYYADLTGGTIRRINFTSGNRTPNAVAKAKPTWGNLPLTVNFDATASHDPDPGDKLTYSWDLNGDGNFDDSTDPKPSFTYNTAGQYNVGLKVTDSHGASATDTVPISAGNTPPTVRISAPAPSLTWAVGDPIDFSGSATDPQDGTLPDSALTWSLILHHCPSNCHTHTVEDFTGVASGSFSAPDHDYPSYLQLRLTATDSGGLTRATSVRLDPKTAELTLQSAPTGLSLTLDDFTGPAPFTRTVILNSDNSISAPLSQTVGGTTYDFHSWSDGRARTHSIKATGPKTYTATYDAR